MAFLDTLKKGLGTAVSYATAPITAPFKAAKSSFDSTVNLAKKAASMANTSDPNKLFSSTGGANSLKNDTTFTVPTGGGVQTVTKSPTPTLQQSNPVTPRGDIGVPQIGSNSVAPKAVSVPNPIAPKPATPAPAPAPAPVNTQISGSNPFGNSNYTPTFSSPAPSAPVSSVAPNQGPEVPTTGYVNAPAPTTVAQPSESELRLKALQEALLGTYSQTPEEKQAQDALVALAQQQAELSGAYRSGTNKIGEQPIVLDLLRGQQQALQKQYEGQVGALADQAKPLEVQLANLVANREQQNKALTTQYGFETDAAKAEREAAMAKDEGFTLGEGQMRYDSAGNLIATGGEKSSAQPASIQEYNFAQQQGFDGSYLDYVKAKNQATSSSSSTPTSYKEWQLSGSPGTYADWVNKTGSGQKPLSGDAAKVLSISTSLPSDVNQLKAAISANPRAAILGMLTGTDTNLARLLDGVADKVGRLRSGGAINTDEAASFKSQIARWTDLPGGDPKPIIEALDRLINEANSITQSVNPNGQIGGSTGGDSLDNILSGLGFKSASNSALNSSIGSLSAKYESGGNPGAIGYDSTGGYSYGTYQLAHNNAQKFVAESPYAQQFAGIPFNSAQFQQKWKEIAQKDPQGFASAQHDYIAKTHLEPIVTRLKAQGMDVSRMSPVVQDVMWSTAVQHGPGNKIIERALASAKDEQDFIKKVYQYRWDNGRGFASSTPAVKQSVYNRFFGANGELAQALARSQA